MLGVLQVFIAATILACILHAVEPLSSHFTVHDILSMSLITTMIVCIFQAVLLYAGSFCVFLVMLLVMLVLALMVVCVPTGRHDDA